MYSDVTNIKKNKKFRNVFVIDVLLFIVLPKHKENTKYLRTILIKINKESSRINVSSP